MTDYFNEFSFVSCRHSTSSEWFSDVASICCLSIVRTRVVEQLVSASQCSHMCCVCCCLSLVRTRVVEQLVSASRCSHMCCVCCCLSVVRTRVVEQLVSASQCSHMCCVCCCLSVVRTRMVEQLVSASRCSHMCCVYVVNCTRQRSNTAKSQKVPSIQVQNDSTFQTFRSVTVNQTYVNFSRYNVISDDCCCCLLWAIADSRHWHYCLVQN